MIDFFWASKRQRKSFRQRKMDKEQLTLRIVEYALHCLGEHISYTTPLIPSIIDGRASGKYFLLISRPKDDSLMVQELVEEDNGVNLLFRTWSFKKNEYWQVVSVERMGKQIFLEDLGDELEDFDKNLDHLLKFTASTGIYFPDELEDSKLQIRLDHRRISFHTILDNYKVRFLSFLSLAAGILLLLSLSLYTGYRFRGIVKVRNEIDQKLVDLTSQSEERFEEISDFIDSADTDLKSLKENLLQNERDLEFNRHQARINVLRLAEELTYYLPARKEAYHLVADNIRDAASYGEIIYEMSRLPSEEYQARILLATAREKVIPFSRFAPAISVMDYPVQLPGKENNGQGFRITSTYLEKRQNPFGTGGYSPHYAIDIINVANISVINYAGEIRRDGNVPGDIVSVAPGYIRYAGWDDRYGWGVEVEHDLVPEVLQKYPDAKGWRTFYSHLALKPDVMYGQRVDRQEHLGYIGNTGASTGPHLHFELRIYRPKGRYSSSAGRYDKVNPYPSEKPQPPKIPVN